jgi:hypothetical protein
MKPLDFFDVIHAAAAAMVIIVSFGLWKMFIKRPVVWVVDDSQLDIDLFRLRIKIDDCDIRYFKDAKSLINAHIKALCFGGSPACVVVDYYLNGSIKGSEVLKHFRQAEIPCIIVTGYEGKISGIAERDVIHKTADDTYYGEVRDWIYSKTRLYT